MRERGLTKKTKKRQTLCWQCAKACGGCSWSSLAHKPVDGWAAERRDIYIRNKPDPLESYIVESCPEYVPDGREHDAPKQDVLPLPESMVEEMISLRENAGLTYEKIANRLGISKLIVRKH